MENNVNIFKPFPIFDELYRIKLQTKITDHFYFKEIGCETVGRFIKNLQVRMNEIMPIFNKMYVTQTLTMRILDNYDVSETMTKALVGTTHEDGTTNSKTLQSDTPQGRLDLTGTNSNFLTDISQGNATDLTNANSTGTENWARSMKGNIGVQTDSDALDNYRKRLIDVDMLVIAQLNDLFMGVY